jgi:transposase InsO family protein
LVLIAGHAGEKKTHAKLRDTYDNIPIMAVRACIAECERCQEKRKRKETVSGTVVRPILVSDLNQRGQVDLVDMQSMKDGSFAFIMHYQEHLSKYHLLRPLQNKTAAEVARELLFIFLDFGAPRVLQSDNGREFTAKIIEELAKMWPELVLVNGRPRHPQTQGSVERSNGVLKDKLVAWMRDTHCAMWSLGIRFVQWQMNSVDSDATTKEPYTVMFGKKPCLGLASSVPMEFLQKIGNGVYEEQILDMIGGLDGELDTEDEQQTDIVGTDEQTDVTGQSRQTENEAQVDIIEYDGQDTQTGGGRTDVPEDARQFEAIDMMEVDGQIDLTITGQTRQTDNTELIEVMIHDEPNMTTHEDREVPDMMEHDEQNSVNEQKTQTENEQIIEVMIHNEPSMTTDEESEIAHMIVHDRENDITGQDGQCVVGAEGGVTREENCDTTVDHFQTIREVAAQGLKRQAKKMTDRSVAKMKDLDVGDNVLIPVSEFDRGRGDPANLIGVVLEKGDRGFKLGTKVGILSGLFARNQIEMTKFNKLKIDMVPEEDDLSIRTAVRLLSVGKGQGKVKCNCKSGCIAMRCNCFKNKRDCTSACHPRITCKNIPK